MELRDLESQLAALNKARKRCDRDVTLLVLLKQGQNELVGFEDVAAFLASDDHDSHTDPVRKQALAAKAAAAQVIVSDYS